MDRLTKGVQDARVKEQQRKQTSFHVQVPSVADLPWSVDTLFDSLVVKTSPGLRPGRVEVIVIILLS